MTRQYVNNQDQVVRSTIRIKPQSYQRIRKYSRQYNLSDNQLMALAVDTLMDDIEQGRRDIVLTLKNRGSEVNSTLLQRALTVGSLEKRGAVDVSSLTHFVPKTDTDVSNMEVAAASAVKE